MSICSSRICELSRQMRIDFGRMEDGMSPDPIQTASTPKLHTSGRPYDTFYRLIYEILH
ncbi:unnamed protein product [Camellia sinensis]